MTRPDASVSPPDIVARETRGREGLYGNDALWVALPPNGEAVLLPLEGGVLGRKFMWWRLVVGELKIKGSRLDGPAPPLRADVPLGYGDSGFQSTGVFFPSEGCWEVIGSVSEKQLRFVVAVRPAQGSAIDRSR